MKHILIVPFLLLVIAGAVVAQDTTWKRYTVKGEEFSVNLPALPALTTRHQPRTPYGRERWERHLGAYADGVVYTIYSLNDGEPQYALKHGGVGTGFYLGWDANSALKVTCDGFTGKQFLSTHPLGGAVQVFATEKHYYRFQAVGAPADDPRVQQFFSSLSLGKNNDGIQVTDGLGTPWEPAGGSSENDAEVYSNKAVDRKAVLVMKLEPSYTDEARQHRTTGTIVMRAVFSATGNVTDIETLSGLPHGLIEQSIDAIRKTKFIPAMKNGKLVSTRMQFEFNFDLY